MSHCAGNYRYIAVSWSCLVFAACQPPEVPDVAYFDLDTYADTKADTGGSDALPTDDGVAQDSVGTKTSDSVSDAAAAEDAAAPDPCVGKKDGAACDAVDKCHKSWACKAEKCAGEPIACEDGNGCTADLCDDAVGCSHPATATTCDDGNPCSVNDTCANKTCKAGGPKDCDEGNPCKAYSCKHNVGCEQVNKDASCSDGDACTVADKCSKGICGGDPKTCDDGKTCTEDSCHFQSGCMFLPNAVSCTDNDACTVGDVCAEGACTAGKGKLKCDDGNVCTDDSCLKTKGCIKAANTAACDDANVCTLKDTCKDMACKPGAAKSCNDNDVCTEDSCNATTGCTFKADNGGACDDGNKCTISTCAGGICKSGAPVPCGDKKPCTADACDPSTGCFHVALSDVPCSNGPCKNTRCVAGHCQVSTLWGTSFAAANDKKNEAVGELHKIPTGLLGVIETGDEFAQSSSYLVQTNHIGSNPSFYELGDSGAESEIEGVVTDGTTAVVYGCTKYPQSACTAWFYSVAVANQFGGKTKPSGPGVLLNQVGASRFGSAAVRDKDRFVIVGGQGGFSGFTGGVLADVSRATGKVMSAPISKDFAWSAVGAGGSGRILVVGSDIKTKDETQARLHVRDTKNKFLYASNFKAAKGFVGGEDVLRTSYGWLVSFNARIAQGHSQSGDSGHAHIAYYSDDGKKLTQLWTRTYTGPFGDTSGKTYLVDVAFLENVPVSGVMPGARALVSVENKGGGKSVSLESHLIGASDAKTDIVRKLAPPVAMDVISAVRKSGILILGGSALGTWKGATKSMGRLQASDGLGHFTCTPTGQCGNPTPVGCDDSSPCTLDVCVKGKGCQYIKVASGAPCDDGKACTTLGKCVNGKCEDSRAELYAKGIDASKEVDEELADVVAKGTTTWVVGGTHAKGFTKPFGTVARLGPGGTLQFRRVKPAVQVDHEAMTSIAAVSPGVFTAGWRRVGGGAQAKDVGAVHYFDAAGKESKVTTMGADGDARLTDIDNVPQVPRAAVVGWSWNKAKTKRTAMHAIVAAAQPTKTDLNPKPKVLFKAEIPNQQLFAVAVTGSARRVMFGVTPDSAKLTIHAATNTASKLTASTARPIPKNYRSVHAAAHHGQVFAAVSTQKGPKHTVWLYRVNAVTAKDIAPQVELKGFGGRASGIASFGDGLLVAGLLDATKTANRAIGMMVDGTGKTIWRKRFGGNVVTNVARVANLGNGFGAIVGTQASATAKRGWMVRFDRDGRADCDATGKCHDAAHCSDPSKPCVFEPCKPDVGCSAGVKLSDGAPCATGKVCKAAVCSAP